MKLGKEDIPKLEKCWMEIDRLKKQREFRGFELLYKPTDTNHGGGKSNLPGNPVQQEVIRLHKDKTYRSLDEMICAIETVYKHSTDEQKLIAQYRYWDKDYTVYEWEDIAHELTKRREDDRVVSRNAALRMRNQMMRDTAERIGWIETE